MKFLINILILSFCCVACNNQSKKSNLSTEKIDSIPKIKPKGNININQTLFDSRRNKYVEYDSNNSNKIIFDTVDKTKIVLSDSTYTENTNLIYKEYKLVVESAYLRDSVSMDESNLFNPVCLKQVLFFYRNDKLKKTQEYPVKTIVQKISGNKHVQMLEDIINYIGIIKGSEGLLLIIDGSGGCSSCSYFEGLYTLGGDLLGYDYSTKYQVYRRVDNIPKILKSYGVDKGEYDRAEYSKVDVY